MGEWLRFFEVELRRVIEEVLRGPLPANVPPPKRLPLSLEAERRGMTTRALRDWCHRHKVEIREDSTRDAWVDPREIDRAIDGFPTATRASSSKTKTETTSEIDKELG